MSTAFSDMSVGTVFQLNEDGTPANFVVVAQDYYSEQNGTGKTFIVRQSPYTTGAWGDAGPYSSSTIAYWMQSTYFNKLDTSVRNIIPYARIYIAYSDGEGTSLSARIFAPGARDLQLGYSFFASNSYTWLRDHGSSSGGMPYFVRENGSSTWQTNGSREYYYKPCFCFNGTSTYLSDSGQIISQPSAPQSISLPVLAMQGQPINISWSEVSGVDSYKLERAINGGTDWTQVYSGKNTTFNENAGNTWTSVQYRVSTFVEDVQSTLTLSPTLHVVPASQLVISGQDGELGTLVNDVPYTVLSDTGNPITLVRTINETNVYSGTVESGFSYTIPIGELPTGNNTIVITATVNTTAGTPYTLTRTWQYIKSPMVFNTSGSIAQLTENQKNVWPITLQEAVNTYSFWGGSLDKAMLRLANSTFYYSTQTAKYTEYTVDMSKVQVGDTVQLPMGGKMHDFIVCSTNYEPTLNTDSTRVLLLDKTMQSGTGQNPMFGSAYTANSQSWQQSDIFASLNNESTGYASRFDDDVKANILTTNYLAGTTDAGNYSTVGTVSSKIFILSLGELRTSDCTIASSNQYRNQDGTLLSNYSQINDVYKKGNPYEVLTRSYSSSITWSFDNNRANGTPFNFKTREKVTTFGSVLFHPCFTLPTTFNKTFYVDIAGAVHPEQEYYAGGSLVSIDGANVPVVKWTEGSYTGTGTYGSGNPCSLSFESRPLYVFIFQQNNQYRAEIDCYALTNSFQQYGYTAYDDGSFRSNGCYALVDGATVSWYYSNNTYQMNISGQTYSYFAILV